MIISENKELLACDLIAIKREEYERLKRIETDYGQLKENNNEQSKMISELTVEEYKLVQENKRLKRLDENVKKQIDYIKKLQQYYEDNKIVANVLLSQNLELLESFYE